MTNDQKKAPSAGTKVDLGRNAPVTQEGPGKVDSESLAAESYREGGTFNENRSENLSSSSQHSSEATSGLATVKDNAPIDPTRYANANANPSSHSENTSSRSENTSRHSKNTSSHSKNNKSSSAGTAPNYVLNQYIRDPSGPHGKNITEGGWDESKTKDGLKAALKSEPGSENDPSRVAEMQFQQNQGRGARDAGPKQESLDNQTKYDALNSDTPA